MDQSTWAQGPALCSVEAEEGVGQNVGGTLRASACTHGLILSGLRRPSHQETPVSSTAAMWLLWVFILFPLPLPSASVPQLPSVEDWRQLLWLDVVSSCRSFLRSCLLMLFWSWALLPVIFLACVNQNSQIRVAFQFTHHSPCLKALDRQEPSRKKI